MGHGSGAELAATKSAILYAPLFIGVSFGVTALGNGMQKGGKQFNSV